MKKNPNYEPEIDIKDMFYHILAKWRSIIVVIILCTAAFGGYGYLKTHVLNDGNDKEYEKELDRYNKEVEIYEKSNQRVDDLVDSYNDQIDQLTEYLDNSVRMNIDPQNEWVAKCDYLVEVDKNVLEELPDSNTQDPADSLLGVYQSLFNESAYDGDVQKIAGIKEEKYLSELINWTISTGTNSFTITIIGNSEQQVSDMLDFYIQRVEGEIKDTAYSITKHVLTRANNMTYKCVDQKLVTEKRNVIDTISSLRASISRARTEQLALVEPSEEAPAKPGGFKKYIIIGFVLGGFLTVAYYTVKYVTGNKLRNSDELHRLYNIPIYGTLPNTITRRPNNGIDGLIERKRGKKNKTDKGVVCEQIASLICGEFEGKKVMLVSSSESGKIKDFYEILLEKIGNKVSISLVQSFVEESDSIKKINDTDVVIVTEVRDETNMAEIDRMGEILDISECFVKGYITL